MDVHILKLLRLFQLQLVLALLGSCQNIDFQNDAASNNNNNNNMEGSKNMEDLVVKDMLKIVDNKFDTLTTRITALERAISGLQFYSIRQFTILRGSLQKTQGGILTVGKKVSQLETDGRGLKIAMSLLNRDVSELKSTTSDVLSELESSVIYINDNVDKQAQVLKNVLDDEANKIVMATDELLVRQTEEELSRKREMEGKKESKAMNCSVEFTSLQERIDVRLQDLKQELVVDYLEPMIDIQSTFLELSTVNNTEQPQSGSIVINKNAKDSRSKPSENINNNEKTLEATSSHEKNVYRNSGVSGNENDLENNKYEENDERLMNLLINMTNSVLQATSYFRQSGGLMEEILSNTYDLNKGQESLKQQLKSLLGMESVAGISERQPRVINDIHNPAKNRRFINVKSFNKPVPFAQKYNLYRHVSPGERRESTVNCGIPNTVLNGLVTVIKNGSQLLEILTDLAQMSSTSLAKSTGSLQQEVSRMEEVRKRMVSELSKHQTADVPTTPDLSSLDRLNNSTKRIQQVVDSNTGWLRLIFRANQRLEKMTNRSLSVSDRNHHILLKNHKHKLSLFDIAKTKAKGKENNEVIRSDMDDGNDVTQPVSGLKEDFVLDKDSIETIYSTSLQLNRIMPALTKLLAEPDPLITLVDGGDDNQGRLEIYNNGQWGTICHKNLTNHEANIVCRHLGFQGGFSAGAGRFGAGTGVAWTLDATCLRSETVCTPVKLLKDMSCDHENDVSIICDHMLRIMARNDTSSNNKTGRLEIMHQGLWLPVCGEGWSGFSARVACKQMGFVDGRELVQEPWLGGANSSWLNKVACKGDEPYLDACRREGWSDSCTNSVPAGVRCL